MSRLEIKDSHLKYHNNQAGPRNVFVLAASLGSTSATVGKLSQGAA